MPEFPIKLVFTDIDGVWTDNGMYYGPEGFVFKKFNTADSAGVAFLAMLNVPVVILTGEDTGETKRRAEKLKMDLVYCGVKSKLALATKLCAERGITLQETAFIGNDLNDLPLLQATGWSAAPADAPEYIKKHVALVMEKKGGEGAFREFTETLLQKFGLLDYALERFVQEINTEE